jgi:hypothetical protein
MESGNDIRDGRVGPRTTREYLPPAFPVRVILKERPFFFERPPPLPERDKEIAMKRKFLLGALVLASFLAPVTARTADDLAALVKKTVEAYGGEEELRKTAAFSQYGAVTSMIRSGATGTLKRFYQGPGKLRVEVAFPGEEAEVRILDGSKGWRKGQAVEGPPLQAMVLQAARLSLPLGLLDRMGGLKEKEPVTRDDNLLRVLEVPLGKGLDMTVEIDPRTGRIMRTAGSIKGGMKGHETIEFVTMYGDFRKVGNVLFPFAETNVTIGQVTGETRLDRIDLSVPSPEKLFAP